MNDFTKEELNDLYAAMRHCYKQNIDLLSDTDTERFSYDLMEKLNTMIDNYCEHECAIDDNCLDKICGRCRKLIG
jgi:hypothetical protein